VCVNVWSARVLIRKLCWFIDNGNLGDLENHYFEGVGVDQY
jgi:hypothetical protein